MAPEDSVLKRYAIKIEQTSFLIFNNIYDDDFFKSVNEIPNRLIIRRY